MHVALPTFWKIYHPPRPFQNTPRLLQKTEPPPDPAGRRPQRVPDGPDDRAPTRGGAQGRRPGRRRSRDRSAATARGRRRLLPQRVHVGGAGLPAALRHGQHHAALHARR